MPPRSRNCARVTPRAAARAARTAMERRQCSLDYARAAPGQKAAAAQREEAAPPRFRLPGGGSSAVQLCGGTGPAWFHGCDCRGAVPGQKAAAALRGGAAPPRFRLPGGGSSVVQLCGGTGSVQLQAIAAAGERLPGESSTVIALWVNEAYAAQ
jgi:hypothetical protein